MRLKTFRAFTLDEALAAIHSDLGQDAAILHTRTYRRGGLLGIGGREIVEVIASEKEPDVSILPAVTRPPAEVTSGSSVDTPREDPVDDDLGSRSERTNPLTNRVRRAYGAGGPARPSSAPDAAASSDEVSTLREEEPARSTSLEVDRDRTRALAKAMEISLEKKRAAREAAGVAGPEDLVGGGPGAASVVEEPESTTTATPEEVSSPASADAATSFIIGPDGVLLPESADSSQTEPEPAPRVVSLDPVDTRPDADTGLPVAAIETEHAPLPGSVGGSAEPEAINPVDSPPSSDPKLESPPVAGNPGDDGHGERKTPDAAPGPSRPWAVAPSSPVGDELQAIGATVHRVLERESPAFEVSGNWVGTGGVGTGDDHPDPLARAYAHLIAQEFSRDLAARVVASLEASLQPEERRDPSIVRRAMLSEIAGLVPTEESIETVVPRDGRPRTIAFVGPTGVGKTTTLAKIAATLRLRDGLRVGFVTADTYRISAVDQLRTYADILESRLEVAGDPEAMRAALARCADLDAVLIDTPGRSQNDTDSLAELRALMDAARPHETHLVLSGTAAERVLVREAEAFSGLGPDRVVLTKLDEAVAFGMLVSVVRRIGRRISWVTTGQEVPRDVERATGNRLADLVLGGAVKS